MEAAAVRLPPLPDFAGTPLEVHQLTGSNFAFQSAFCLWSLGHAAQRPLAPVFYDDGTLTAAHQKNLLSVFPQARLVTHEETAARLEIHLPEKRFPVLRHQFLNPIPKSASCSIFTSAPPAGNSASMPISSSSAAPIFCSIGWPLRKHPLHLVDVADAYGYSPSLLEKLAGSPLPQRVNVGLCGLRSDSLDWEKIEGWSARLIQAEGSHYLLEQALVALLLAGKSCAVAPATDYLTLPTREETLSPSAVMHHLCRRVQALVFPRLLAAHPFTDTLLVTSLPAPVTATTSSSPDLLLSYRLITRNPVSAYLT